MESDKRGLLRHEQVKLLYDAIPLSILATLINGVVLVAVGWEMVDRMASISWLATLMVISFARLALTFFYRRTRPGLEQTGQWETYFTIGSIAAGLVWGAAALFQFPEHSMAHQVFVAFIVGGMCAGAITSLSPLSLQLFSFLILALAPLIVRFFMVGSELANMMGEMLLLFLIMISISGLRIHRNIKQNISFRMQSEEQETLILESHLEQQAILDNAPVGIWLVGTDGRYHFVNRTFCDAIGVAEREFLDGTDPGDLLGGGEAARQWLNADRACFEQDGACHSLETLTFADKSEHLLEVTRVNIRDNTGKITGVVGISADITERHQAEERLRILSQAIEQASESIIITDKAGLIEYVNPSFTRITGYTPEEVLGEKPGVIKGAGQSPEDYERIWKTVTAESAWNSTIIACRKNGGLYPALMCIAPIRDENGQISHFVGIQQDMTTNKALEEKFMQAQKMEGIGILVAGIAHEFNNMLAGMTGNLYLAKTEVADVPSVVKHLENVENLSFRAADMIKQLLTFARKGMLVLQPFDFTLCMHAASQVAREGMPDHISFHTEFCEEKLIVKGDCAQFQQLLINLINNACDAVEGVAEPMVCLRVEAFEADDEFMRNCPEVGDSQFVHMSVSDNGCGISDEEKAHIFEPFYSTKGVGHGTGLGLSMAYGMVQSHHGVIEVESKPGNGSVFHVYLPLLAEENVDALGDEDSAVVPGKGEVILVVDDNAAVRRACSSVLKRTGYQVLEAADGFEAIELFTANQDRISLIIMDVVMPGLSGVDAVERINALSPDVKVIFTTGYDKQEMLNSKLTSDEYPVIFKPFSIVKLSQMIRQQLDV